jgi:hypothetical protein
MIGDMKAIRELLGRVGGSGRTAPLVVGEGRVWCPNRGDISIDRCVGCPRFVAYDGRQLTCRDDRPWWWSESA